MNQRGQADVFFALLLFALFVGGLIWLTGWGLFAWGPFSSEVKAYPIYCEGEIKENRCKGKIVLHGPEVFSVFPEQQRVTYQDLESNEPPVELPNCTVRDKYNWTCDKWSQITMVNGNLKHPYDTVRYVPKWKWWLCRNRMQITMNYRTNHCNGDWES